MERKISFENVKKAVDAAYQANKANADGAVDPRLDAAPADFAISVVLTDGRKYEIGDSTKGAPLGDIAKVPVAITLLSQLDGKDCGCGCGCKCGDAKKPKPEIPVSRHGVRMVSRIAPSSDADGKWDVIMDTVLNMTAEAPVLDDALYKSLTTQNEKEDTVNRLAQAGYELYDDATIAVDLYTRLTALKFTTGNLAALGATLAADGRNPFTGRFAFDGKYAPTAVAAMAVKGKGKIHRRWLVRTGIPAKAGFGGLMVAVLPGFGAIAAYSPLLDCNAVPAKAAAAIKDIAFTLGLNVFASARVQVEP